MLRKPSRLRIFGASGFGKLRQQNSKKQILGCLSFGRIEGGLNNQNRVVCIIVV